ncbi:GspE/PulE family protein [Vibrio owensii]|uniref:GspE/PulE family protein n=1 Tax=Vibrio harveyi group TaxID=717610 RepID=UPI003CC6143E
MDSTNKNNNISRDDALADHLINDGLILPVELQAARMEQEHTKEELGNILVKNGFLPHDKLIEILLEITDNNLSSEELILAHVPASLLQDLNTKICAQTVKNVFMATINPHAEVRHHLQKYFPAQDIVFVESSYDAIETYLDKLSTINDSQASALEMLVRKAIGLSVSDIHIIPRFETYTVLFRHMGVRKLEHEGTYEEYLQLAARIKDKSRMDLAEKRVPQDGGFSIEYNGRLVDLRVATVPTTGGESIIIRVLDPKNSNKKLKDLGISNLDAWQQGASRLNGMCLVCGATGSGKTTTLNGTVRELDRFGKAIYTAEDPVEYQIPYIGQCNINESVGLDFARALKAFMRSDPDIIILGEIRDEDTARNAIKAAETGHLVFATLHTSSILGAVNRFRDLNVPLHELKYILRSVLAQMLVRTLCESCGGKGCKKCYETGYAGRTIVSECHYFSSVDEVEDIMSNKKVVWKTMIEDAYEKYEQGLTDYKELDRVFGAEFQALALKKQKEKGA